MWSLRALLLLLVASLAVNASPVPTPPDNIQAQENFNLLRSEACCWLGCAPDLHVFLSLP